MGIQLIGRATGIAVLCLGLAACLDVEMEIELLDEERGRTTATMAMDRQFYDMAQAQQGMEEEGFCDDGELTVDETTAYCVEVTEGTFDEIIEAEPGEEAPTIVAEGDGLVRVTIPTGSITDELGADSAPDAETMQMMQAIFAGRAVTLRVRGAEIVESNMDISEDRSSAQLVIPFTDLLDGPTDIPDPVYALVRVR